MRAKHVLANLQNWSNDINGPYRASDDEFDVIFKSVFIVSALEDAIIEEMDDRMSNLKPLGGDSEAFRDIYVQTIEDWLERLKSAKFEA